MHMKHHISFFACACVSFALLSKNAFGYIDPGTGGIIIQSVWGYVAALAALVGGFFSFAISKIFKKKKKNENK